MTCWPEELQIAAVDLTSDMLAIAQRWVKELGITADLSLGDVQALVFPDASFDTAVATFVLGSVTDPILGLRELARVMHPGGQLFLLEHTRPVHPVMGRLMDWMNPVMVRLTGANMNRRPVENVQMAGWHIEYLEGLGIGSIFKLIITRVR